jgi:hypothetical protein
MRILGKCRAPCLLSGTLSMRPNFSLPSHHHLNCLSSTKWRLRKNGISSRSGYQAYSLQRARLVAVSTSTEILYEYDLTLLHVMQELEASSKMRTTSL